MSAEPPTMYEPPPLASLAPLAPKSRPGAYGAAVARGFDLPAFLRRSAGWILGAAVLLVWWTCTRPAGIAAEGPIDWAAEPLQGEAGREAFTLDTRKGAVTLHPRAAYDAAAVVEGAERYRFDRTAFLSPVDLVLTWGELPRAPYQGEISYAQMARFYHWHTSSPELDLDYIAEHSANTHLIPANDNVRRAVLTVDRGDEVRIRGLLVDVVAENGLTWSTSRSRGDTGQGACELVYVEEIQVGDRVYR